VRLITRRRALGGIAASLAAPVVLAPGVLRAAARPTVTDGVMSGDVTGDEATVWSRADRPARMLVEWSTTESFRDAHRVQGATARADNDFTATAMLAGLPAGQTIFYRVRFEAIDGGGTSDFAVGRVRTPRASGISFVFGGDQCGAGWGINPDWGGLRLYETMLRADPDFLVHLGDRIYSDDVLAETVTLPDGSIWRNVVTPAKAKAASTLDDYRGNYRYNLLDDHVRRFNASVPQLVTWDDHEVTNDWWPGRVIGAERARSLGYDTRDADRLAARGRKAFFEYTPVGPDASRAQRIWRSIPYGPLVEVFLLDERSHRSPNRLAGQGRMAGDARLLGDEQIAWLKAALLRSTALWKVIASPLPLAHYNPADTERADFDKFADGAGALPVGRETEAAGILALIRQNAIRNTVWIAADVHYAAANEFHPDRAAFKTFTPFWEFIAGPFHTRPGSPRALDPTFGPKRHYVSTQGMKGNPPPSAGWINFGHVTIDGASGAMTVAFRNLAGQAMWQTTIEAAR
jgi:alkaline phosphatase D